MKFYRFMDDRELLRFLKGSILYSNRDLNQSRTPSIGYLFFDDSKPVENRIPYMVGKEDISNVVEFLVLNPGRFVKSIGQYSSPAKDKTYMSKLGIAELFALTLKPRQEIVTVREYRTRMYSMADLQILRIGIPGMFVGSKEGEYMVKWKGVDEWEKEKKDSLEL